MADDWLKPFLESQFAELRHSLDRHADDDHRSFQAVHARIDAQGVEVKMLRDTATKAHVWAKVASAVTGFISAVGLVIFGNWYRKP